jgi:hypothetical protein
VPHSQVGFGKGHDLSSRHLQHLQSRFPCRTQADSATKIEDRLKVCLPKTEISPDFLARSCFAAATRASVSSWYMPGDCNSPSDRPAHTRLLKLLVITRLRSQVASSRTRVAQPGSSRRKAANRPFRLQVIMICRTPGKAHPGDRRRRCSPDYHPSRANETTRLS